MAVWRACAVDVWPARVVAVWPERAVPVRWACAVGALAVAVWCTRLSSATAVAVRRAWAVARRTETVAVRPATSCRGRSSSAYQIASALNAISSRMNPALPQPPDPLSFATRRSLVQSAAY
ncbi:MAG: hypothetical protein OXG09_11955 [Chloroflexi bacterium]|nr:hypothetical protein [Chloroflexota bacterium]